MILLVVESTQNQLWPTLLVPFWGWLSSDAVSVDLSLQTIAAKVQTSTSFLNEAAEDAALSAKADRISKEELHAASLCQGLGADVFRTVRSRAFQGSLLKKYCSGSCKGSRMFQGINMCSRDAAMYTVSAIRRRLNSAAKDPSCACIDCNFPACGAHLLCRDSAKLGTGLIDCSDDVLHGLFSSLIFNTVDICLSRITLDTINILNNIPNSDIFHLARRQGMEKCADLMFPGGLAFFTI